MNVSALLLDTLDTGAERRHQFLPLWSGLLLCCAILLFPQTALAQGLALSSTTVTIQEGATGTFTAALTSQPTATVTVSVTSDDTGAATVSPAALTFTTTDWATAQSVTASAVEDGDTANETVAVTLAASGGDYAGISATATVTVDDDDTIGLVLSWIDVETREKHFFYPAFPVALGSQPSATVTVTVTNPDPGAVELTPTALTFTTANWSTSQNVSVIPEDDDDAADETVLVTLTASGGDYAGVNGTVTVTVIDSETAEMTLSGAPVALTEGGTDGTFTMVLTRVPTESVTMAVASSDTEAVTTSPAALTFTTTNWNTAQTVTASAVDDDDASDETVTVTVTASGAREYESMTRTATVTVTDDDTVGLTLSGSPVALTEGGTDGAFTVALATQPSAEVTVSVASSDAGAATASPAALTFTTSDWNTAQSVTANAVDDDDATDETVTVTLAASGGDYAGINATATVTVEDDETPGLTLSAQSVAVTEGSAGTFTVALATQPTATVSVSVTSDDTGAATVSPATLTFTTSDWNTAQSVTAAAVNDANATDETVTVTLAASGGDYAGISATATVSVEDDETIGFDPKNADGFTLKEGDSGALFPVVLTSQPTATVTVTVTSSDTGAVSLHSAVLTYTTTTWDEIQSHWVDMRPVNDADAADETVTLTMTASGGDYEGATDTITVYVDDDETARLALDGTPVALTEGGADETFTVMLSHVPTESVTVAIASGDTGAATVSPAALTFTTSNWNTAQTVTTRAVDDDDATDEGVSVTLTGSGAREYGSVTATATVSVDDDDTEGLTLSATNVSLTEGGTDGAFTVALATQPTAEVTVSLRSGNASAVTVSPAALTYTTSNWNTAQTVTASAVEDDDAADEMITVGLSADGGDYGRVDATLTVSVEDDETPGLTLSAQSVAVTEGSAGTFTLALATQPTATATVTVTGASSDTGAVTVNSAALTFTTSDWGTAQTVTVNAVQDDDASDETVTVTLAANGGDYADVSATATVSVDDDDAAGLTLSPTTRVISEGRYESFAVTLATQPSAEVTVSVTSSDEDAVTATPAALTYTTSNWSTAQTVRVEAVADDDAADETVAVTLAAEGGDYADVSATATVSVNDDETTGLTLSATRVSLTEGGETESFTVVLASQPTASVTVAVTSSDEGAVAATPAALTYTTSNWATAQTVTTRAVEDDDASDEAVTVTLAASGGDYADLSATATVSVRDDDTVALTLSATSVAVAEGETGTFTVALATQPSAEVTVSMRSTDTGAVTMSPATLTFTTGNWNTTQTVTASAVEDDDAADETVTVGLSAGGGDYASVRAEATVTVEDDETIGLALSATSVELTEGDAVGTFTVALATQPTGSVTVSVSSSDTGAATVSPRSLVYTTSDWDTAQTVTVTPERDDDASDETVTVTLAASGGDYADVSATVTVTVTDDETVGLTLNRTTLTLDEGRVGTFTVRLATQPSAAVTVSVTSADEGAVAASPAALTFMMSNWTTNQTVTVSAVEDTDATDETVAVTLAAEGGDYAGISTTATVSVNDDETTGLSLSATSVSLSEGGSETFTMVLVSQPTASVTVAVTSSDVGAVTASPAALTYTTSNWNTAQTVTASAVEDDNASDEAVTVTLTASGGGYADLSATTTVSVRDDDTVGLALSATSVAVAEGSTGTFTVALETQPSTEVTVSLRSGDADAATVSPTALTFTTTNWNTAQAVTASAGEDDDAADETVTVGLSASGGDYGRVSAAVTVTVDDDETIELALSAMNLALTEGGAAGTFTVALATQPTATVSVSVASNDTPAATVTPRSLVYTTSNWATAQTVTVNAVQDVDAASETVTVTLAASGGDYADVSAMVTVAVTDDETAELTLSVGDRLEVNEGVTGTFTVVLPHVPTGSVTVSLTSADADAATVSPATLTFTAGDWRTAQTVTVSAVEDTDGTDETVTISLAASGAREYATARGTVTVEVKDPDETTQEKEVVEEVLADVSLGLLRSARDVLHQRFEAEPKTGLEMDLSGALRALETDSTGSTGSAGMSEALGDSHFTLALDGESGQGSGWTMWGRGSYMDIENEGRSDSDHETELQTAWLGIDRRFGDDVMGGVALSYADVETDYNLKSTGETVSKSELEMEITSIHPYARWETSPGSAVWAMLGVGQGDVELTSATTENKTIESDVDYWMVAFGGRELLSPMSGMELALVADVGYARLETDATAEESAISDLSVESWQARAGIEAQADWGDGVSPFGAIYGRYDGGDGAEGVGLELRGGLSLAQPTSRLQLDIEGHWVAAHSESDYEEWGASLTAAVLPAADRRGWSWKVRSGLGQEASDSSVLWGDEQLESLAGSEQWRGLSLSASVGWGFGLATGRGVLTPFAEATMTSGEWDEAKLGLRYILPETEKWSLELSLGQRKDEEVGNFIGMEFSLRD